MEAIRDCLYSIHVTEQISWYFCKLVSRKIYIKLYKRSTNAKELTVTTLTLRKKMLNRCGVATYTEILAFSSETKGRKFLWYLLVQSTFLCCLKVIFCLYDGTNSIMHLGSKLIFYSVRWRYTLKWAVSSESVGQWQKSHVVTTIWFLWKDWMDLTHSEPINWLHKSNEQTCSLQLTDSVWQSVTSHRQNAHSLHKYPGTKLGTTGFAGPD